MEESHYGFHVTVPIDFEEARDRTVDALRQEGFGVLTSIDVKKTLKEKLNKEFRRYVILGACNPVLASQALEAELEIGLLLPCNVIVYEGHPGHSVVAAMAPVPALGLVGSTRPELKAIASQADARLRRALQTVETSAAGLTVTK